MIFLSFLSFLFFYIILLSHFIFFFLPQLICVSYA